MRFKTKPMAHQLNALDSMKGKAAFALLMEQGTGKTKVIIDDAARLWAEHKIDALLVVAPNGVHIKWVTSELPKHMPDWCPFIGAYYLSGGSKRHTATIDRLFEPRAARTLRVLTINYEAVTTNDGIKLIDRFTNAFRCYAVADESQRIKTPSSQRTKAMLKRRARYPVRRIMTGTPMTNAPFDVFSQFSFLDPTILRTQSYAAFKAEYADMLPAHSALVQNIVAKNGLHRIPQIVARDREGQPVYRNLEKLQRLIAPHSFRVLKKDCLDLPDKVYDVLTFELTPRQRQIYDQITKDSRIEFDKLVAGWHDKDEQAKRMLILQARIQIIAKQQQITSGYMILEEGNTVRLFDDVMKNPRNVVLMETIEDTQGKVIIWAPHTDKINQIIECLRRAYDDKDVVRYDGGTAKKDRMDMVDRFQDGAARFFVGNPASGGTGLTLSAAETAIYYSNSFNLEHRIQSEDRNHRIGTTSKVTYYDIEAVDTIDHIIIQSNQAKQKLADIITGDSK